MRRRMVVVLALLVVAPFLLAGCSTHYHNRLHPEYGQTDFDRDWYECQRVTHIPPRGSPERMGVPGRSLTIT